MIMHSLLYQTKQSTINHTCETDVPPFWKDSMPTGHAFHHLWLHMIKHKSELKAHERAKNLIEEYIKINNIFDFYRWHTVAFLVRHFWSLWFCSNDESHQPTWMIGWLSTFGIVGSIVSNRHVLEHVSCTKNEPQKLGVLDFVGVDGTSCGVFWWGISSKQIARQFCN